MCMCNRVDEMLYNRSRRGGIVGDKKTRITITEGNAED